MLDGIMHSLLLSFKELFFTEVGILERMSEGSIQQNMWFDSQLLRHMNDTCFLFTCFKNLFSCCSYTL